MKHETHSTTTSSARPAWTYTVQAPRTFSLLWAFERLSALSVPLAAIALIILASGFALVPMH